MPSIFVMYGVPEDPAGFDAHYRDVHVPLMQQIPALETARVARVTGTPRGEPAPYHVVAELIFPSAKALAEASRSPEMGATSRDAMALCQRFGVEATMLVAEEAF